MARSLSTATALAASLSESAALLVNRRGYAAASAASKGRSVEQKTAVRKMVDSSASSSSSSSAASTNSWVPDPVTGYYRPGNLRVQADAAELRKMFLSNKQ